MKVEDCGCGHSKRCRDSALPGRCRVRRERQTRAEVVQPQSGRRGWPVGVDVSQSPAVTGSPRCTGIQPTEETARTYQDQRRIIESVAGVDVYTFGYLFLAHLQIASSAGFAKYSEAFADVKWVFLPKSASIDFLTFGMECLLDVMLPNHHALGYRSLKTQNREETGDGCNGMALWRVIAFENLYRLQMR
jgi:hypothetical protein